MNNNDDKSEVQKEESVQETPKTREIIISTDGTNINLVKAEVAGKIELIAILQNLISYLNQK